MPKFLLVACAATFFLGPLSLCSADDAATTNAPAMSAATNSTQTAQSQKAAKAEMKKDAEAKKQAEKAIKNGQLAPIPAPPLPISIDKQKELADLLAKYKTNQISPEEYHKARAKILAEQ